MKSDRLMIDAGRGDRKSFLPASHSRIVSEHKCVITSRGSPTQSIEGPQEGLELATEGNPPESDMSRGSPTNTGYGCLSNVIGEGGINERN